MKKRIKIDSSLLVFLIIFTAFLYQFTKLYPQNRFVDDLFDILGLCTVLGGVLIRMSARGHKKFFSQKSESLVQSGLYTLTRNPMYLGSFMLGAGFILMVWPWWSLILFALLFYLRFNKQMKKEEQFLSEKFGKEYETYCQKVPRIFPSLPSLVRVKLREVFDWDQAFSTKEKRGLIAWPFLAVILEVLQEKVVFGTSDIVAIFLFFASIEIVFLSLLGIRYRYQK